MKSVLRNSVKRSYLHLRNALLAAGARIVRWEPATGGSNPEVRRILFIRIDRVGDMVVSTPALRSIKYTFPNVHVTVLASPCNAPLLQHDECVDQVIVWDPGHATVPAVDFLCKACRLGMGRYDAVIDPTVGHDLRTALLARVSRAPIRIGYPGHGREVFFNRLCRAGEDRHMIDLVLETTRLLGAGAAERAPRLRLLPAEHRWARQWLAASRLDDRPVVTLHPGAHYPSQRWPTDFYARLAQLLRDLGCGVLLSGGPADRDILACIRSAVKGLVVFETSDLRRSAALIGNSDVLVCNNSGPLHIASALDVATLSFMGPTEKTRWMPLGRHHIVLRQEHLDCIGCNRGTCGRGDHACMRTISPEAALARLLPLLRECGTPATRPAGPRSSRSRGILHRPLETAPV